VQYGRGVVGSRQSYTLFGYLPNNEKSQLFLCIELLKAFVTVSRDIFPCFHSQHYVLANYSNHCSGHGSFAQAGYRYRVWRIVGSVCNLISAICTLKWLSGLFYQRCRNLRTIRVLPVYYKKFGHVKDPLIAAAIAFFVCAGVSWHRLQSCARFLPVSIRKQHALRT